MTCFFLFLFFFLVIFVILDVCFFSPTSAIFSITPLYIYWKLKPLTANITCDLRKITWVLGLQSTRDCRWESQVEIEMIYHSLSFIWYWVTCSSESGENMTKGCHWWITKLNITICSYHFRSLVLSLFLL